MTNPLEQIRDLVNNWQKSRNFSGGDLAHSILAILDASQDYVCVPVEAIQKNAEDAKRLRALERAMGEYVEKYPYGWAYSAIRWVTKRADEILREGEPHDQD